MKKQFTITCEPNGLRIHLRSDHNPNQDFGVLFPPAAIEQAQRYCNTVLGLPDGTPFASIDIAGTRVYYSRTVKEGR